MMKKKEYIGKKVRIKPNSRHPHAGEAGEVIRIDNVKTIGDGLVIKEENFGEEFFVFNLNHLQILE